jgi:hypothetical protein
MATPVVVVPSGGIAVTEVVNGLPVTAVANYGFAVTVVASGGLAVTGVDAGSSVGPDYRMIARPGAFQLGGESMEIVTGIAMLAGAGAFTLAFNDATLVPPAPTSITWDAARMDTPYIVLTNGNLTATLDSPRSGYFSFVKGSGAGHSTGKYCFTALTGTHNNSRVGICNAAFPLFGDSAVNLNMNHFGWGSNAGATTGASPYGPVGSGWTTGDTVTIAVDFTAMRIWLRVNSGLWNNDGAANPATGTNGLQMDAGGFVLLPGPYFPFVGLQIPGNSWTANFEPASPPAGFLPW